MQPNPSHTDMAHPYNMLWPYLHAVPPLTTHNTDISMFHAAFASQLGTHYNDIDSAFPAEQYVSNIAFQQQKQQQLQKNNHQHHQQQLQRQNDKLLQHHNNSRDLYLQKLGYEFKPTHSTHHFISSHSSLESDNSISKKKRSHITISDKDNENINTTQTPKKGHSFTIDFILNKDDNKYGIVNEDKSPGNTSASACDSSELSDRRSCSPPEPTSPSPLGPPSPPTPSFLPVLHSTPNLFHSERFSRRHDRITEVCHPYFHKQFEYYSNSQTHPNFQQQQPNSFEQQQQQQQQQHHVSHHHQHESSHRNSFGPSSTNSSTTSFSSSSPSESMTSPGNEPKESKLSNKTKRIRTIFTPEQLERLEAEFDRQQYMVGTERFYLASSLNLTEAQVKVWFQNRRIKWRKQHLEQQQARLAQGDLYRDLDDSDDSDHEDEAMTSVMSSSQDEEN